ncbi:SLC13 family permease [Zavarzinia sp. CC-PAN008]|uniref:SLC13 family permease n=1 Tax=Zavarzinia sp. CC-PAN008 TaxID=3243332 RepID=UPI003F747E0D
MTDQILAFAILAAVVGMLIWDRFRFDLVALAGLVAAVAAGIVPAGEAFRGFSDDIVVIVASALVISAAVGRSGIVDALVRPLNPVLQRPTRQVGILAPAVAIMSAFVKNIGAVAMMLPVVLQVSRRAGTSPSLLLMPLAFASLLGGLVTLVGTSPNIIVSRVREEITGTPFGMFDFAPVGLGVAAVGLLFLVLGYRLVPQRIQQGTTGALFDISDYNVEVVIPAGSPFIDKTVFDLEAAGEEEVTVTGIIRLNNQYFVPHGHWWLFEKDTLFLQGDPNAVKRLIDVARLSLVAHAEVPDDGPLRRDNVSTHEAVVTETSPLVGRSPAELRLRDRFLVNLLALSRGGAQVTARVQDTPLRAGDVLVLQGPADTVGETLGRLGLLPLAKRDVQLGSGGNRFLAVGILAVAVLLIAVQAVPVTFGFFGAAVCMLLTGCLTLEEAYQAIEWPILILIGALIPISESIQTTGGADLIAGWLAMGAEHLPGWGIISLTIAVAMAITPFLNNAATVLVMAPIAAGLAANLGLNPDPFLMAVAVGAACDFLTPIGHQCNTLVMGPGGYRFGDYWRLGLPLSLIVVVTATPLIAWVWPMAAALP